MSSIWKKYFFTELLKVMLLFLGCFYFIYILIDYASHTKIFQNEQIRFLDIFLYYLFQFTKRADILLSVALMISTIKVLTTSNMRLETVALTCGGIPLKKIIQPFLMVALACSALLYLNLQFLQPYSLSRIASFEDHFFKDRGKSHTKKPVNALVLEDNSLLIYQSFDQTCNAFFDVYWLKNKDHFYRIKWLFPYEKKPLGKYVDSLMRTNEGEIVKFASQEEIYFSEMCFDSKALYTAVHPPSMQSLTQLARQLGGKQTFFGMHKISDREAEAITYFYYKLTLPLVCLLAVIGPAPFCLRFSRNLPVFLIYALSLCVMVVFFTFVNSSVILGASQVIPPIIAISMPQTLFFLILGWNYAKL